MTEQYEKGTPLSRWHESETIRTALIAAVVSVIVGVVTGIASFYAAWSVAEGKNRELDIKFVEIGIAILRADPKDENTAKIRDWAIDVVALYAPKERKFMPED